MAVDRQVTTMVNGVTNGIRDINESKGFLHHHIKEYTIQGQGRDEYVRARWRCWWKTSYHVEWSTKGNPIRYNRNIEANCLSNNNREDQSKEISTMQTIRAVCDASCSSHHSGGECSMLVAVQDWAYVRLEVHIGIHDSILTRLPCGIEYFTRLGGSPNLDSPQIDSLNLELTISSKHKLIDPTLTRIQWFLSKPWPMSVKVTLLVLIFGYQSGP